LHRSFGHRVRSAAPAIVTGAVVFATSGAAAKGADLHPAERMAFAAVNQLDDAAHRPVWLIMQAGSLGAVGVASAAAWLARRQTTAVALAVTGTAVWGGAKVVKRLFGRGRPADHIADLTIRGRPASGLGFPSGHAAVATALAVIAAPDLPPVVRVAAYSVAGATAMARVYVGAHLPADVVGGFGLGLATGALTNAVRFNDASPSR
jgi:membrane-associated phospholipid phosphatase